MKSLNYNNPNVAFLMQAIMETPKGRSITNLRAMLNPILFGATLSLTIKADASVKDMAKQFEVASRRQLFRGLRVAQKILRDEMVLAGLGDFDSTQKQMDYHLISFARAVRIHRT